MKGIKSVLTTVFVLAATVCGSMAAADNSSAIAPMLEPYTIGEVPAVDTFLDESEAEAEPEPELDLFHNSSRELLAKNWREQMLYQVNKHRRKHKLKPLCRNTRLQEAALLHSKDMAKHNFMGHTGSNGSSVGSRVTKKRFPWNSLAENVAAGQTSIVAVVNSWMKSPGHRANILGNYKFFGAGYAYRKGTTYGHYWTQNFAGSSSAHCN